VYVCNCFDKLKEDVRDSFPYILFIIGGQH
jgi:hypothetical protein